jgi:hypothetical protein
MCSGGGEEVRGAEPHMSDRSPALGPTRVDRSTRPSAEDRPIGLDRPRSGAYSVPSASATRYPISSVRRRSQLEMAKSLSRPYGDPWRSPVGTADPQPRAMQAGAAALPEAVRVSSRLNDDRLDRGRVRSSRGHYLKPQPVWVPSRIGVRHDRARTSAGDDDPPSSVRKTHPGVLCSRPEGLACGFTVR